MTNRLYRCGHCGNRTRFDVYDTVQRRRYEHASLAGEVTVEDEAVTERTVVRVVCRWCDRDDDIQDLGPAIASAAVPPRTAPPRPQQTY